MKEIIKIMICLLLLVSGTSCNDFLQTLPDNRTQINSATKINQLLVSAYSGANYSTLGELSADNFNDNNAPNENGVYYNLASFSLQEDQYYAWQPATFSTQQDSPSYIWGSCYAAIAAANQALASIEELKKNNNSLDLDAQKGEALFCRAYHHFILVNIFSQAYKDSTASLQDIGIPYSTTPETVLVQQYSRETVTSVYNHIQKDIEEGYNLINDQIYNVPKNHFNKQAAGAFAARFYLFKRDYNKVLKYANDVLGSDPTVLMRDWSSKYQNLSAAGYDYIDPSHACNLMILPTKSLFFRSIGKRYGITGDAQRSTINGAGPTWTSRLPAFLGKVYTITGHSDYGGFIPKFVEMFEYTDKIAGIGFAHIVRTEFTAEETLLCRAEALVYLNRLPEALADLQIWNKSHLVTTPLSEPHIKAFYTLQNTVYVKKINPDKMSAAFIVSDQQLPYIQCILHFRRIESVLDGTRWFDIKRYGIEISHAIGLFKVENLTYNDPRRAIQLPQEVISAGIDPNPSQNSGTNGNIFSLLNN